MKMPCEFDKPTIANMALEYYEEMLVAKDELLARFNACPAGYPLIQSINDEIAEMDETIRDGMSEAYEVIFEETTEEPLEFILQKIKSLKK